MKKSLIRKVNENKKIFKENLLRAKKQDINETSF